MSEWGSGDRVGPFILETAFQVTGGGGQWAVGRRGGCGFHLKLPEAPKAPGPKSPLPEVLKAIQTAEFNKYVKKWQRKISELVKISKESVEPHLLPPLEVHEVTTPNAISRRPVIVSEFVGGVETNLSSLKSRDERLQYLASATAQVSSIHARGLVHSDIKPENLPSWRNGKIVYARLLDFDGSFFTDEIPDSDNYVFDQNYAAPEAIRYGNGEKFPVSTALAVDVFSLGVITLNVFEFPWHQKDRGYPGEQVARGTSVHMAALAHLESAGFSTEQSTLIARAVSLDPALRPTADALSSCFKIAFLGPRASGDASVVTIYPGTESYPGAVKIPDALGMRGALKTGVDSSAGGAAVTTGIASTLALSGTAESPTSAGAVVSGSSAKPSSSAGFLMKGLTPPAEGTGGEGESLGLTGNIPSPSVEFSMKGLGRDSKPVAPSSPSKPETDGKEIPPIAKDKSDEL